MDTFDPTAFFAKHGIDFRETALPDGSTYLEFGNASQPDEARERLTMVILPRPADVASTRA